ncbi:family 20 glycosylhydrolase [Maribellus sp. YY47]|uniref:glycoside hydrolase family 20 protein n=1 Tax=Maribellus sp. YY47 TaxID=2929486 RepID=UPI0020013E9C|nr:family 20 glycosylhydrolase [Maribellus sp. YY47]MCK3684145.1 glycoside hydrolase family 20 protein [Maribellus sp. YY47]
MKKLISLMFLAIFCQELFSQTIDIIPQPAKVITQDGSFTLTRSTRILFNITNADGKAFVAQAQELLEDASGIKPEVVPVSGPAIPGNILVQLNNPLNAQTGTEGYNVKVEKDRIFLNANTTAGLYYGMQTLWQMLTSGDGKTIPCVDITDYPRLSWRGMMLDVSRHYYPVEFIYKYIDYLAMHKMNVFHWHLVDDQGWRIEIKKYPKLTEIGAWRADRENLDWNSRKAPLKANEPQYGGFYTQDQIKSVVEYARQKHVTVIPEIEMPAHAMAALAAYPELSCTGEYQPVPSGGVWPITHIFCAGKEETFHFLEDVLKEVMELFPSTFIHIGGDEATKTEWEKCALCQKRMKDENLANEHELQAYFIKRMEKFLNSYGRHLIGWDEILEGGVNPSATIMSWRGTGPGIEAAKAGHDVVMTPTDYSYFDYYQGEPSLEPKAIGGHLTLKKVYSFEPVPKELTEEEGKHIIGAQANLWTEYIPTTEHAEYMIMPRMTALAEVAWSPKEAKDWASFSKRMESQYKRYEKMGANYATSAFQVKGSAELNPENRSVKVTLSTEAWQPEIHYTVDGSEPNANSEKYTGPFEIQQTTTVKAVVVENGKTMSKPLSSTFYLHKAIACPVTLKFPNSKNYNSTGDFALVDGIKGSSNHTDGRWKGFNGDDLVATIDLGKETSFSTVTIGALQNVGGWIFYPTEMIVESSDDGVTFKKVGSVKNKVDANDGERQVKDITVKKKASAKYLRVTVKNYGTCPKGHAGEGKPAWLFVDEISVE